MTGASRIQTTVVKLVLIGYMLIAMAPIILMVLNSFRSTQDMFQNPLGLPTSPTFEGYVRAWQQASFEVYVVNSVLVTVVAVLLSASVSTLAAYALARWDFRGRSIIEGTIIAGLMVPAIVALLPLFYLIDSLRLIDSPWSLVLIYAANGIPFSVFILSTFVRQIPAEIEEAATIDGAGPLRTFGLIALPLLRPAIATVVVFRFVPIWNDFIFPLVMLRSPARYTLPVGLTRFFGEYSTDWSSLFAGLVISTVPLVIIYIVATKQIVRGLTAGIGK